MYQQATRELSLVTVSTKPEKLTTTEKNNTNLGKRKKSEPSEANSDVSDDLDPVVKSESRKKIQKVTHSSTIDGELVENKKNDMMFELCFIQTEMACACGTQHTITLSNDGTAHSFGRNKEGALGLGHNNSISLPTPIPNLPKINMICSELTIIISTK